VIDIMTSRAGRELAYRRVFQDDRSFSALRYLRDLVRLSRLLGETENDAASPGRGGAS
jgi:hypothetical protein